MTENEPVDGDPPFLGRYVVRQQIHVGGMSRVYQAHDLERETVVALKRPARDDPGTLARFLDEAAFLSELTHPAIVRRLAHGGTSFQDAHIAMEWLDGETLSNRLLSGPLALADAVSVARRAAEALSTAHRAQIVHRDLKPANLILCQGSPGQTKLIDFGIARREAAPGLSVHASFAGGTWAYMSPEQAMGSAELGARTDVYSLGCVLFETITGYAAFPSDRAQAVVAKVWQAPPSLADFSEDVPKALVTLIAKALATDPMQRQRDGGAFAAELLALGKLPERVAKPRARPSTR
ncbi:MAG TPA: serine/threonine-protein kinase [Polyangiaceae bacterium]|nr:serine/threonine-protein kinase [Polyangiaceae bacterium]